MMLTPTNRASLWRYDDSQPHDYEDNEFFCGGMTVQYTQNGGRCGECGDNWAKPKPRSNENGGTYGNGIVTANYTVGDVIETYVRLTSNHKGTFAYSLCILEDPSQPETEDCFQPLKLADGTDLYAVSSTEKEIYNLIQLPADVKCDRCVLRWHYRAGNNWGPCGDGTYDEGCGDQETFRSCADISIF
ncbi:uncharacterized protein LOC109595603 isoform X2 [Aethina tumida]|nr:uncharacterized protein LOC109595603 isoform X2 [Aethina tumida]